jgi:hypothetical protein
MVRQLGGLTIHIMVGVTGRSSATGKISTNLKSGCIFKLGNFLKSA